MVIMMGWVVRADSQTGTSEPLTRFTFTEYHMGIDARLVVYARTQDVAEKGCRAAFDRIAALDAIMSDYRKDSELNLLCDKAGAGWVKVSGDLFKVLRRSLEISKQTDGAFDISAAPIIQLWRKARKTAVLPDPTELEAARKLVGWQNIELDGRSRSVRLRIPGMKLDLGGIAKGYAADEAQKVLRRHGIVSALIEMGGDVVLSDAPPGTKGWTVRVPNAGDDRGPAEMHLANCAVSSSGDTEQFVVIGGIQYSHVVNPKTGQALTNRVQATVIARDGFVTDPLSTAMTLLDKPKREKLISYYPGTKGYVRTLPMPGK